MVLVEKPLIAVTGATGRQGGSVIGYLLQDGAFRVRALTRKPGSATAKELQGKGVEVAYADFEDQQSLENGLQGAYGVFGVTNFWEGMDDEKEVRHGKALVDAAKACNIQHFVWSTVSAPPKDLDVKHWASKAQVNEYLISSGLPRTSLFTTFYFENFLYFDFAKLSKEEVPSSSSSTSVPRSEPQTRKFVAKWPLMLSDGLIGGYSVKETGAYVLEAFKGPKKWINKDLYIPPDIFTPRTFVNALNDALGGKATVELEVIDAEAFAKARTSGPGAEELWTNMGKYIFIPWQDCSIPGPPFSDKICVLPIIAAFYQAEGKMRNMNMNMNMNTGTSLKTDGNSEYPEEMEQAILPTRLTIRDWVKAHVHEILDAAL